jgi:3-hydroxyacyl-[acyl-carrier-protein] dehydratase
MPGSLIVEGIGQTGGLLFAERFQFQAAIVLAKVSKVQFHCLARPGDTLVYRVALDGVSDTGARLVGTSHIGDKLQTEVQMFLAVLSEKQGVPALFEPSDWSRMLRDLYIYDVGVTADGQPLTVPAWLTEHEQRVISAGVDP